MRRALREAVFLVLFLVVCSIGAGDASAEKRVALIIGNSNYENVARLANPANDAALMAETFKSAGFDKVDLRRDLKIADMRRALREFVDNSSEADVAVVYFAGHGIEVDGSNYLVPVDAALQRDVDIYDEALSLERILVAVEPARQLRLVILDACRDNPFSRSMKRTIASRAVGRGLAKVEPTNRNTLIAFASKAGSTAADGEGKNSPFSAALAKHVTKPGLDLRKAFGYVRDDVLKSTGNRQEPYVYGSLGGDDLPLVPAASSVPAAPAVPQADSDAAVRRAYELALQAGVRDAWEAFLQAYPDGFYANLAKVQLRKIATEESRSAADKAAERARLADGKSAPTAESKVAVLQPSAPVGPTRAELTTSLQRELRRVGCLTATANGEWNAASERSLSAFNKNAGTKFDLKAAGADALEAVRSKKGRVCPLSCEPGYRAEGERCTKMEANNPPPAPAEPVDLPREQAMARAAAAYANGTYKTCMGATPGCFERGTAPNGRFRGDPEGARKWCARRPTC
jgi:uncharacterized caspase-like protein